MSFSISGVASSGREVRIGVHQWSALGPILFLIYVNNLMDGTLCQWKAFASDFKLCTYYNSGTSNFANCKKLHSYLDTIFAVCSSWNLRRNPGKCVSMSFGRSSTPASYEYRISGLVLKRVHTYKDLGVIIYFRNKKIKFSHHRYHISQIL